MKKYLLAKEVGHYGLFNGSKFRNIIIPEIKAFTAKHSQPLSQKNIAEPFKKKEK
jgi:poly(3-hydroxybutyrate) depolymerase